MKLELFSLALVQVSGCRLVCEDRPFFERESVHRLVSDLLGWQLRYDEMNFFLLLDRLALQQGLNVELLLFARQGVRGLLFHVGFLEGLEVREVD